jgi:O-phosphoseryl-tRNA(Cys) synthetase
LAELAEDHGIPLADLVRRRLFEWQLPRPQVDLQTARQYAVLHDLSVTLRNAVSNLHGLARAYHSGFPVEGQELVQVIAQGRGQVEALGRAFGGGEE